MATAKKTAAKKAPAKKTVAKKTVAKKTASPKPAAKRAAKAKPAAKTSGLFLSKDKYNETITGLMDQGLDREDAVATLRVGLRQANGKPVPAELLYGTEGSQSISQVAEHSVA